MFHKQPLGFSSGFNKNGKWVWDKASWTKCSCGLHHSNRFIPRVFWEQDWVITKQLNRKKAGIILIRDFHEIWITQSYHKCYGFPKGEKEENETIEQCAKREFLEETGTNIYNISLDDKYVINTYIEDVEYVFYIIHVNKHFDLVTVPIDDVEITSFGWISITRLKTLILSKAMKNILPKLLRHLHKIKEN